MVRCKYFFKVFCLFTLLIEFNCSCVDYQDYRTSFSEKTCLKDLKDQIISVLKDRLSELERYIIERKRELTDQSTSSEETSFEDNDLKLLEKHYDETKIKLVELEKIFKKSGDANWLNANRIKLFLLFSAMIAGTGGIGYYFHKKCKDQTLRWFVYGMCGIVSIFGLLSYYFSESIALALAEADKLDPEKYENIYKIVGELAVSANIPVPKLWSVPQGIPNAFATGRNKNNASIVVTRGLLEILNEDELRGVLAHEISHIKNCDIMIMSATQIISMPLLVIAKVLKDTSSDDNSLTRLFVGWFSELAVKLMSLMVSRSREYTADETGARIALDPISLANALSKIREKMRSKYNDSNNFSSSEIAFTKGFEPMFILSSFSDDDESDDKVRSFVEWLKELFSTHPSTKKRIAKLKEMDQSYRELLMKTQESCS